MKKYPAVLFLLFLAVVIPAQKYYDYIDAFLLPEELFKFSIDDQNRILSDNRIAALPGLKGLQSA